MADVRHRLEAALSGRYQVHGEIGSGGMGTVYVADDLKHDRPVAIKVLSPRTAERIGTDRFHQEIRIAASLNHPHIVALHDSGEADGLLFYVMPHVEGESLRDRLDRGQRLITIKGPSGTGKTRLAAEFSRDRSAARNPSNRAPRRASFSALRFSGRFSVIRRTAGAASSTSSFSYTSSGCAIARA